ncbi:hypothetical protein WUBG_18023 [Wuchereria bancrofti]|uniref:Uncharacterized protein n=1 Tax=Wuchereria bancrofti TaxID=6293 RepID=J9AAV4_WUCBA|nr:hypothetical protein WUBG_18023 [Wuchereria bancrofti]
MRKNYDVTVIDLVSSIKSAFNRKEMMVWKQGLGFLQIKRLLSILEKL